MPTASVRSRPQGSLPRPRKTHSRLLKAAARRSLSCRSRAAGRAFRAERPEIGLHAGRDGRKTGSTPPASDPLWDFWDLCWDRPDVRRQACAPDEGLAGRSGRSGAVKRRTRTMLRGGVPPQADHPARSSLFLLPFRSRRHIRSRSSILQFQILQFQQSCRLDPANAHAVHSDACPCIDLFHHAYRHAAHERLDHGPQVARRLGDIGP